MMYQSCLSKILCEIRLGLLCYNRLRQALQQALYEWHWPVQQSQVWSHQPDFSLRSLGAQWLHLATSSAFER